MFSFHKLLGAVTLALIYGAAASLAAPASSSGSIRHATHRVREITPDFKLDTFHPLSTLETFGEGIDHPLSKRSSASLSENAESFVQSHLKVDKSTLKFRTGFTNEVGSNAYLTQVHDGIPFANAVANVAFNKENKVAAFGSSFVKPKSISSSTPTIALSDAIASAEKTLNGKFNNWPAKIEFFAKEDGTAVLTHVVQIENEATGAWFEAFVDAHTGEVVSVTDFVTQASYLVLPIQKEILTEGFETLTDPQNLASSPHGWHSDGTLAGTTTGTAGNNAISFKTNQANITQQSSPDLNFIFVQDPNQAPTVQNNLDAARVNAFYLVNSIHDIAYQYGFTEATFNFQNNNFGLGGAGNDRVTISVQDAAGLNNADFSTPADGQSGRMRMFLWNETPIERDGALENDIVSHEQTHGITNRMTGGGTGRCLQSNEAGGMGEGWSDTMADWLEKTSAAVPDYVLGQYVTNNPAGIRTHPYSTDPTVNPLTYADLKTRTEVHSIGEIWANTLHNVYAALVGAHGFSPNAKTDATTGEGNVVFLHLFIDALAIQPCNPTFLSARDAWIQADVNRFSGANKCILWNAFASKGLGVNAANHNNDNTVPAGC